MVAIHTTIAEDSMPKPVIRMFRATIKRGAERDFQSFFLEEALPMVKRQDGLVSVQVGLPLESSPSQFSMVTTWKDLASVKKFAGANWEQAVIDPREAPFIEESFVTHYYAASI
jgi:heme-degrading monooxygenase HmoA